MMKTRSKLEKEGNFLHVIKGIYEKLTANIILNSERLNTDVCSYHFNNT